LLLFTSPDDEAKSRTAESNAQKASSGHWDGSGCAQQQRSAKRGGGRYLFGPGCEFEQKSEAKMG
jgi:hypothetical protein